MLSEKAKAIADETARVKAELISVIKSKIPEKRQRYAIIKLSELDAGILSAEHYNTNYQLKCILMYLDKRTLTLEAIVKGFNSIVDTGSAPAFDRLQFNAETRKVLSELL